jgi:hypothetical protein
MDLRGPLNGAAAAAREGQVRPQDDDRADDRRDPAARREAPTAVGGRVVPEHCVPDEAAHGRQTDKRGPIPIVLSLYPIGIKATRVRRGLLHPAAQGEIKA